jgi:hypothetical protein
MMTTTCASTTLACATMEAPHERAERLARRDAIELAVLDREATEHNRERSETLGQALARIAGKGAMDDG